MIVAPGARSIEVARPDAKAAAASRGFFCPVAARGDGETFSHHDGAEVAAIDAAGGQKTIVLIDILGATIGRACREELSHAVACDPAAGPGLPVNTGAVLCEFRGIEAQQAYAVPAQAEAVAIAGAGVAGNRRRGPIQRGGNQCQNGQNSNGEDSPARTPKDGIVPASSLQDFTAR